MIGAGFACRALAASVAACGEAPPPTPNEASGELPRQGRQGGSPTDHGLGQTSQLRIGVRNNGEKTVPAVAVTISIAGKAGENSSLPFGVHDAQPELAQPDRPVWVLAEGSPQIAGPRTAVRNPGGATTSSHKTFDFGPLKPGAEVEGSGR